MRSSEFNYHLPEELIAQEPISPRDASRLLIVHKDNGRLEEARFSDIKSFFSSGDLLVLNDTRVFPARIFGQKTSGARLEFLLLKEISEGVWESLIRPAKRFKHNSQVIFGKGEVTARLKERTHKGTFIVEFSPPQIKPLLEKYGKMPTPPYIKKELKSISQYQTVYARKEGAVAAPTAGFHFTKKVLKELSDKGVEQIFVTLHVGLGTFRTIKSENIEEHRMDEETYSISEGVAEKINDALINDRRVIAVGTTVTRALESSAVQKGGGYIVAPGEETTDLFIYPPYRFKIIKALLTNFHLPLSTNYVLVSTFIGLELARRAYDYAIKNRFRFYSFGDAMLII